ncbi:MAG: DNA polymerase III subunit alpha [Bacteroidetes bacterium]|nr:DNA polymerase III subunit alpha [Bacteroidota bacterium]
MYLVFDTETTGLPRDWNAPLSDVDNWPRVVQVAWQLHDPDGALIEARDFLIKPEGFNIPFGAEEIHGISTELARTEGVSAPDALAAFQSALDRTQFMVGHNLKFDLNALGAEYVRLGWDESWITKPVLDTMTPQTAALVGIPGRSGFKPAKLGELHAKLFGQEFSEAHNATADVEATARCFWELVRIRHWQPAQLGVQPDQLESFIAAHPHLVSPIGLTHRNLKAASAALKARVSAPAAPTEAPAAAVAYQDTPFFHLHVHSQFSVLQATTKVPELIKRVAADGQPAVALTDLGNMMGAFQFVQGVQTHNKNRPEGTPELKAIMGMDAYVCRNHLDRSQKDDGYQIPLLAKNKTGYHNLAKLSSIAYITGFYYVPRIDRDLLLAHKEGVMVTTGGIMGEVPQLILNVGEKQAEEAFLWWKEQFGADFYAEINRHGLPEEDAINEVLRRFCDRHGVKAVAANNSFYLDEAQAEAHDILLCVKESEKKATPIGRGRGFRYGLPNSKFYLTTQAEMRQRFADWPEALANLGEILEKVENFGLARDVLLPAFEIPQEFVHPDDATDGGKRGENAYLRHLTYVGAKKRWGDPVPTEIAERLDFELETIERTGYPGYFLIVQDFCQAARDMGVSVGPGRGSAAGSAVAYATGITNVDPITYDLLFERFLNPDRVSLPDIDIDFDDRGRDKVIQYVIDKYGSNQVAQIITYGSMAAKSAIKDAGRALDLPFDEADRLTKSVPDNSSLPAILDADDATIREKFRNEDYDKAVALRQMAKGNDLKAATLQQAKVLEGSLRNTGIHACGVIITPSDIRELIPVATAKDSAMWTTQFDNAVVESAGLLKMDFLGLKTLTLIKDSLELVRKRHGVEIDIEAIPLDDVATYELFQRGDTVGIFQYESPGMQKHLKDLKPTVFGDLIAMNALYRPGPLEYIPSFIRRKHGVEPISYDLVDMEEYLSETYGITVYQEQVMLLSQKLAGFTKGQADMLRKAMGKKIKAVLDQMKPQFVQGGIERGHAEPILDKVWKDWEAFASYAFNKSHSTCYAWIAYQTAYLKAHYPAEYMAAVLSNNMNDIKQVTFFMEECRRMKLHVLGPDINESEGSFTVNREGAIRFGLLGMKGVGAAAVDFLLQDRADHGPYTSVFDAARRLDLRVVNKGTWESLALGGAFDRFEGVHRAMFFAEESDGRPFVERLRRYGQAYQDQLNSAQVSLFGEDSGVDTPEPALPQVPTWNNLELLKREKEVIGIYVSAHPLDAFRFELKTFRKQSVGELSSLDAFVQGKGARDFVVAGIVTNAQVRTTRTGREMGSFVLEDEEGATEFVLFGQQFLDLRSFFVNDLMVLVRGRVQRPAWARDDNQAKLVADIHKIQLLSELFDREARGLTLFAAVQDITPATWGELAQILRAHPGKQRLQFHIGDAASQTQLRLPSRGSGVQISRELLGHLDELKHFHAAVRLD